MTFEAAQSIYIDRMDDSAFCRAVGIKQELLLRTTHKDDLDGSFAAAVTEEIAS